MTLDLFTCDVSLEDRNIKKIICDHFSISTFNVVIPDTFNDDDIVALIAVKLYALTSYNPELFILQFIYCILV